MKKTIESFSNALRGISLAIAGERNMKLHLLAMAGVIVLGLLGRVEPFAWCALLICCALVIGMELINTALEALCDHLSPDKHPAIRNVKDISAGAVLACAILSAIVALVVFLRPEILKNIAERLKM